VRVLVTGAGGLLGGELAMLLAARGLDVVAIWRRTPPPVGLRSIVVELTDRGALERTLEEEKPDAVVHAAVISRTDECEREPAVAEAVNARLPAHLAAACRSRGLRLVGLSTDLVLGGDRAFSDEETPPGPVSVYGRTKLAGEEALLEADPTAAVARVALVVGRGHGPRPTASEAVVWALREGHRPRLYQDEYRTPVDAASVADAVARLLTRGGAGRFHLGGSERLSRLSLGRRVARVLGLPSQGIEAGLQADHPGPDRRPPDTSLDSRRARSELDWSPRPLDVALAESRVFPRSAPANPPTLGS
jgi:dTDP-4-dehydrorhamnose reductase